MQRVVILGCSGAGKSTLARKMGERLGLPQIHLDHLYFIQGWKTGDPAVFRERLASAVAAERWIVDGNFLTLTGDLAMPRADSVIWLEQPRWLCLLRVAWRCIDPRGFGRADLPAGCRDSLSGQMLSFIWTFDRVARPNIERVLAANAPGIKPVRLHGDRAIEAFLAKLGTS